MASALKLAEIEQFKNKRSMNVATGPPGPLSADRVAGRVEIYRWIGQSCGTVIPWEALLSSSRTSGCGGEEDQEFWS
ncbi:MAG: hypothetical protein B7Z34_04370 [Novosphingobium sp. 12-62-10]|nr:MAG: hypothetical protein B7Z34_04370 [Novosphingobium sp. 12-62-10]